jgi:hypothetical protein
MIYVSKMYNFISFPNGCIRCTPFKVHKTKYITNTYRKITLTYSECNVILYNTGAYILVITLLEQYFLSNNAALDTTSVAT